MPHRIFEFLVLVAALVVGPPALAAQVESAAGVARAGSFGILVMAHGGDDGWNESVEAAVEGVSPEVPVVVAYGMADPHTLQTALDSLDGLGVQRVALVRMFLSGASFLDQTEYLLGLTETPPVSFIPSHGSAGRSSHATGDRPAPLAHDLEIATHSGGMVDSGHVRDIVVERALALSTDPAAESVLLLAHGMGDDGLNDRLLAAMAEFETAIAARPFAAVRSATLREDWAVPRAVAEREIREFVGGENRQGRRVIVVPVRLSGFGPYAAVLDGLDYVAAEGLLPHENVTDWIVHTACAILCTNGQGSPLIETMPSEHDTHPGH